MRREHGLLSLMAVPSLVLILPRGRWASTCIRSLPGCERSAIFQEYQSDPLTDAPWSGVAHSSPVVGRGGLEPPTPAVTSPERRSTLLPAPDRPREHGQRL